jgi:hypothetical protein
MDSTLYWVHIVSTLIAKRGYFQFFSEWHAKKYNMCNLMEQS